MTFFIATKNFLSFNCVHLDSRLRSPEFPLMFTTRALIWNFLPQFRYQHYGRIGYCKHLLFFVMGKKIELIARNNQHHKRSYLMDWRLSSAVSPRFIHVHPIVELVCHSSQPTGLRSNFSKSHHCFENSLFCWFNQWHSYAIGETLVCDRAFSCRCWILLIGWVVPTVNS